MTEEILQRFDVEYLQVMDENGRVDEKLMPKLTDKQIKDMYEWMVRTRTFDDKALKMQRQGRLGTYASMRGQEACQVGSAINTEKEDFIFPAFRENGVFMMKGVPQENVLLFWAGDERGMKIPKNVNIFSISITVGAHPLHAVGAAMAFKYQKKKSVALTYFGDGATSEGDFHEAMNFAGVYKAPVVFICQNNQWAISVPVAEQTASKTIAQKAIAYGFKGIRVDGNDVFAVYKATNEALENARAGKGPTLIECFTYRMSDHTTSDDAKRYRREEEVKQWEKKDPILRLKRYMESKGLFSSDYEKQVFEKAQKETDEAVIRAENMKPYGPEDMFNYVYETITPDLKEQQIKFKEMVRNESALFSEKKETKVGEKGFGVVGELEEAEEKGGK